MKVKWLFGGTKLFLHAKKSISQYDMKRVGQVPLWDLNVMWLQAQLSFFVISCGFVGQCLLFLCGGTLDVSCDDKKTGITSVSVACPVLFSSFLSWELPNLKVQ